MNINFKNKGCTLRNLFIINLLAFSFVSCGSVKDDLIDLPFEIRQPIPFIPGLVADGLSGDWPGSYTPLKILSDICGNIPDSNDFQTSFRIAWNETGLFIQAEITDDTVYEDPDKFWNGDGLELFLSPARGSLNIIQVSVRPGFELSDSLAACRIYDHRRSELLIESETSIIFCCEKSSHGYTLEGFVPLELIGIEPDQDTAMAIQLYLNDADHEDDQENHSLPWYSIRDSYRNPYACHSIRFTADQYPEMHPEIRTCIVDEQTVHLKVIGDRAYDEQTFRIISGALQHRFKLNSKGPGLKHWTFPEHKIPSGRGSFVGLQLEEKTLQVLDLEMAHRVYEKMDPPEWYENEIRIFEIMDKYSRPPDSAILFTGSSTIRRWYSLADDMDQRAVINRGFGGSVMEELNLNLERIVFPYNPSMILVYEGDNDITRGTTPSAFLDECKIFINQCRHRLPDTEIIFLSIKPSPARMRYWKQMARANSMLEDFCRTQENVTFIDISSPMFKKPGILKSDIYAGDKVHLNEKGYALLTQVIKSNLSK